jgi:hypothetical protein
MRANVPLRDARPTVIVCPHCARHLMEVKDVQWALTRLEFTFACAGCGTEVTRAIAGDAEVPAARSRASALLRELPIFTFSPERIGAGAQRALGPGRHSRPDPEAAGSAAVEPAKAPRT